MKRLSLTTLVLLAALLALIACGPVEPASPTTAVAEESTDDLPLPATATPAGDVAAEAPNPLSGVTTLSDDLLALLPAFDEADIQTTASGLRYVILETGSGDLPVAGDTVNAHYSGYLVDGTKFDSSLDRGTPFAFPLGQGSVIQGWDEGFALLQPGAKALLIIPPDLGYGTFGSPPTIPADATLVFDVELLDVQAARRPVEVAEADYTVTDSGLKLYDIEVGNGATPANGDIVTIEFAVWDAVTGELYGSSEQNGRPIGFPLGANQMFPAMEEGVATMQVGGVRQLYMPAALLVGSGLPEENDIIFEVELVELGAAGPAEPTEVADDAFIEVEGGVRYADISVGDGPALAAGEVVQVHYTVWLDDGTRLDSSYDRNSPEVLPFGSSGVPGWNEGLVGINVGGVRQIYVPAEIVGDIGLGQTTGLLFEVEIVGVGE